MSRSEDVSFKIDRQQSLANFIILAYEKLMIVGVKKLTRERITTRLNDVKKQWELFVTNHNSIQLAVSKASKKDQQIFLDTPYFSEDHHARTYEIYLDTLEQMEVLLNKTESIPTSAHAPRSDYCSSSLLIPLTNSMSSRLPRINLPQFSGSSSEWLPFKDLFKSLVLDCSPVEKLQYLKTSLVGSAAGLLQNTPLIAENFQKSWDLLVSFYENRRILVNNTLQSLFALKKLSNESSTEIETLFTSVMQIYQTLESLGRPVNKWDDLLVYMIVQRLDPESVKAWEHNLGSSKDPPTWTMFQKFLYARMTSLRAFEDSQSTSSSLQPQKQMTRSRFLNNNEGVCTTTSDVELCCPLCSSRHQLIKCPKYLAKSLDVRKDFVSRQRLCFNCLGRHRVGNCRSPKRCIHCGRRHNSSLHRKVGQSVEKEPNSQVSTSQPPRAQPAVHNRTQSS